MALLAIEDTTGQADVDRVRSSFEAVSSAFRARRKAPVRPVAVVVEKMPIMGSTESTGEGHVLHLSLHAAQGGMLEGLIAHEMGHMVLIEARHPSHDPEVHARARERVPIPLSVRKPFSRVAHEALNHAEDIYADDLAIPSMIRDLAYPFFAEWVRNAASAPRDPWQDVLGALDVGFALGNLERHALLKEWDPLRDVARDFASRRRIRGLDALRALYRDLPEPIQAGECEDRLATLLDLALKEVQGRAG